MVEINKNQYTCHSGYVGLPALRSPVAPIAARIPVYAFKYFQGLQFGLFEFEDLQPN